MKLNSVTPWTGRIVRKFHRHIPISLLVEPEPYGIPLYWRVDDVDQALVEIGIHRHAGSFVSLTLVTLQKAPAELTQPPPSLEPGTPFVLPAFNLDLWPRRHEARTRYDYYDVVGPFELALATDQARLQLLPEPILSWIWTDNCLAFGLTEAQELGCVWLLDLSEREQELLRSGLAIPQPTRQSS